MISRTKLKHLVFSACLFLIIFMAGCASLHSNPENTVLPTPEKSATKTNEGIVTVELTPTKYDNGLFIIEYSLNTHSVDMSIINLQSQTSLEFGGNQYTPVNNPALTGHHNSGELQFKIPSKPESFTITMRSIPDVEERVFSWP